VFGGLCIGGKRVGCKNLDRVLYIFLLLLFLFSCFFQAQNRDEVHCLTRFAMDKEVKSRWVYFSLSN